MSETAECVSAQAFGMGREQRQDALAHGAALAATRALGDSGSKPLSCLTLYATVCVLASPWALLRSPSGW